MGKGSCASSSPSSQRPIVCCMCGDEGLAQELFRCKICVFRSQHKYCSDLYPRTTKYQACNWCLREDGGKTASPDTSADRQISRESSDKSSGNGSTVTLIERTSLFRLNKPIKKPLRILIRQTARRDTLSPGTAMKGKQHFRAKVQRYKLLEEVSR